MKELLSPLKAIGAKLLCPRGLAILYALLVPDWNYVFADGDLQKIERVKAAFVMNIARFVTWPSGVFKTENSPHHLCLYRRNLLGEAVSTIRGGQLSGRELQTQTLNSLSESGNCTVLVIPYQELDRYHQELPESPRSALLTIADLTGGGAMTGISREGIMISMVREGNRIALEVDLTQSQQVGLQVSSQLLKLARILDREKDR